MSDPASFRPVPAAGEREEEWEPGDVARVQWRQDGATFLSLTAIRARDNDGWRTPSLAFLDDSAVVSVLPLMDEADSDDIAATDLGQDAFTAPVVAVPAAGEREERVTCERCAGHGGPGGLAPCRKCGGAGYYLAPAVPVGVQPEPAEDEYDRMAEERVAPIDPAGWHDDTAPSFPAVPVVHPEPGDRAADYAQGYRNGYEAALQGDVSPFCECGHYATHHRSTGCKWCDCPRMTYRSGPQPKEGELR